MFGRLASLVALICVLHLPGTAQPDSSRLQVSLLTCAPGDELYSIFGHTAVRVIDSTQHTDFVFNYGTFNFDDPDFYSKFVKGKLDYFLSVAAYPEFMNEYVATNRDVTEQVLGLNVKQKTELYDALKLNLQGSNRYYKYDFLRDNCTSRVRNLLLNYGGMTVTRPLVPAGTSYRDLIHEYLDRQHMEWTKLGMDLLMGRPADKALSIRETMFLPDYLMKGTDSAAGLVQEKRVQKFSAPHPVSRFPWPLVTLGVVCCAILLLTFSADRRAVAAVRVADLLLFTITGLIGCLLLFTWFGTDHASFKSNYNLFWALPTNIFAAMAVWSRPKQMKRYFLAASVVYGLLLVTWYWLPQELNPALIPVVLLLFLRTGSYLKN